MSPPFAINSIGQRARFEIDPKAHPGLAQDQEHARQRHHPCFGMLGPGWVWLTDYYSTRIVWLHWSGLHIIYDSFGPLAMSYNDAIYSGRVHRRFVAIAATLNDGVARNLTGWHVLWPMGTPEAPAYKLEAGAPLAWPEEVVP